MNRSRPRCLILVAVSLTFPARALFGGADGDDGWKKHFDAGNDAYERCDLAEAENQLRKALEIASRVEVPDRRVVQTINALARVVLAEGPYDDAEQILNRARAINQTWIGKENAEMAETLDLLGVACSRKRACKNVDSLFDDSLAMRTKLFGPDHPVVAMSLTHLGELRTRQGRFAEAESLLNRALRIREKAYGTDNPAVAATIEDLALLRAAKGNHAAAEPLFRTSLEILERTMGKEHCELVLLLKHYATTLRALHRDDEADALEARSIALIEFDP
jgi:tetratricopeptide (TPR) repeat protein